MRETEIIDNRDRFAFSKRTQGFVPRTIFIHDQSAEKRYEKPVLYFQEFGVPNPKELWNSIEEAEIKEITPSVIYDLFHKDLEFPFDRNEVAFMGSEVISFLNSLGYYLPPPERKLEGKYIPLWPPRPVLLTDEPEWRSLEFQEDREARERRFWNKEIEKSILKSCELCARKVTLFNVLPDPLCYVHAGTLSNLYRTCGAQKIHYKRKTLALWVDLRKYKREEAVS